MKHNPHKQSKKSHLSFKEYGENSHHLSKKIKTHMQQKANNAIDKALRVKSLRNLVDMDDF
jgi:hypothetical protein